MRCHGVRRHLVDYTDGLLTGQLFDDVRRHVESCTRCRREADVLNRSLALANEIWSSGLPTRVEMPMDVVRSDITIDGKGAENSPQRQARRLRRLAILATVAASVFALVTGLLSHFNRPSEEYPSNAPTVAGRASGEFLSRLDDDLAEAIQREESAARMAYSAEILARQPGGERFALTSRQFLARNFLDTAAGVAAASLIQESEEN